MRSDESSFVQSLVDEMKNGEIRSSVGIIGSGVRRRAAAVVLGRARIHGKFGRFERYRYAKRLD